MLFQRGVKNTFYSLYVYITSRRPRIACYFTNDRDKADVSQQMEAVRSQLAGRLGVATYSDVLEELLSHYEGSWENSFAGNNQPTCDSKQIMVERPEPEGQQHICEEQQLRLLVDGDVLEELLSHYEGSWENSFAGNNQPTCDSKQIMVERPEPEGQQHICEEQQLRLLVDGVTRRCPKCHKVAWRMEEGKMKGHVLCTNVVCTTPRCNHQQRWLSSSILGDHFTVNARYEDL